MPIEDEPISIDSTRGMDLLDPSLERVKDGASSLYSIVVQGKPVVGAVLKADPVGVVQEGKFAMEINLMVAAAAGTNSSFDNFRRTEFFNPTFPVERIMIRFKTLDGTEGTGYAGSVLIIPGRHV